MAELWLAAERSEGAIGPAEAPIALRRTKAAVAPADCVFTPSVLTLPTVRPAMVPSAESRSIPVAVGPQRELIEPLTDAQPDIAGELNRFGESCEVAGPGTPLSAPSKPRFDPIDPGTTLDTGLAFELNRISDGITLAWETAGPPEEPQPQPSPRPTHPDPIPTRVVAEPPSPPGPSPDVARAIRLTGEAVHAWMRLMTRAYGVRVSAR
jgi:hypothetical protein